MQRKIKIIPAKRIEGIRLRKDLPIDAPAIHETAQGMIEYLKKIKGLGLAACQIGIPERWFVAKIDNQYIICIYPAYKPIASGKTKMWRETCLSYPNEAYNVRRYQKIFATWETPDGDNITECANMFGNQDAIIFQHETDHCNGKTIKMIGQRVRK